MTYAIDDAHSNQLTAGLSDEVDAFNVAHQLANARGESVYLYEDKPDSEIIEIEPED